MTRTLLYGLAKDVGKRLNNVLNSILRIFKQTSREQDNQQPPFAID